MRALLIGAYAIGAAMTFNFAHPVDCSYATTHNQLSDCIVGNIKESAISAAVWPAFWIGEVTK